MNINIQKESVAVNNVDVKKKNDEDDEKEMEEKDEIYILNRSTVEENINNDVSTNLESTGSRSLSQSKRHMKKEKDREKEKESKFEILELQREVVELLKQVQLDRAVISQREEEIAGISRYSTSTSYVDYTSPL